ncbi:MAG: RdgB/HAM1 family non-canonical purine NTP pyrophosphatase [Provencibacterium sp.]|nr:RdgB/HAM1 family non-canonical purine NTP pyrophosphatase [Provencibacterium sp.]
MTQIIAATNNPHKVEELRRILAPMGFEVLSLGQANISVHPEETAETFTGNALLKAQTVFDLCALPTIADDSGLCVKALGGRPGVHSARYGGEGLSDAQRVSRLLQEMEGVPEKERSAKFVCAICCFLNRDTVLECTGECEGRIGYEPVGEDGFGYDPVFMVGGRSYAQLNAEEKDAISHRGRALKNLQELLAPYQARAAAD